MKKLLKMLNRLPYDKALHLVYGSLIFIFVLFMASFLSIAWGVALYAVIAIALLKEIYDFINKSRHTSDIWDFFATIIIPILFSVYLYFYR